MALFDTRPSCWLCQEQISTEYYLDLAPFGLGAEVCERCVQKNLRPTWGLYQ